MPPLRWVGIDQGYSQLGLAVLTPEGQVLASVRTQDPPGDGHDRAIALLRLRGLLHRLTQLRGTPVRLAGYCYAESGVHAAFAEAGWRVEGEKALNDVVGVYGLSAMSGDMLVAGCGTFSQVVHVDRRHAVRWPGEDVRLPEWLLSGQAYARFLATLAGEAGAPPAWAEEVRAVGGAAGVDAAPATWARRGPLLSASLDLPAARGFVARAATAVRQSRAVFWRHAGTAGPPAVVLGGGAVGDDRLWALLVECLRPHGIRPWRAVGDPAVGLARFAMAHPDADPWAVAGRVRPAWLSG